MAIKDTEDLVKAIKGVLATNLNTQITAINTEKADSMTIDSVSDYYYHLTELPNKDPFINIAIKPIKTESLHQNTARIIKLGIDLVFRAENIDGEKQIFKSLRYTRALVQALQKGAFEFDIKVEEMQPLPLDTGGEQVLVCGVEVTSALA